MEINYKTINKYLEEKYLKVEQKGITYYYTMTGKVAAIEENGIITMYYDAPKELVETQYGKLAVSIIDNFKIATQEKTKTINAMYITNVTENRNNIKVVENSIIVPTFNYELYEKRYSLGTIGILEKDEKNKYHLKNEEFDIEFKNEKFTEENTMENIKILELKEIETSENNENMDKLDMNNIYNYYYEYFKKPNKTLFELSYQLRARKNKTYDILEQPIITTPQKTKTKQPQKVKTLNEINKK